MFILGILIYLAVLALALILARAAALGDALWARRVDHELQR